MNVSLGVLLAPYRVDYYNHLHDDCDCEIYFLQRGFDGQLYSSDSVEAQSTYRPRYLRTVRFGKDRRIAVGLRQILRRPGIRNVIVPEFSILTLQVILLKLLFRYRFNIISQCDDSYDMLSGGQNFSRFHMLSRRMCMPFLKNLILVDKRSVIWYQERYGKGIWMPIIRDDSKSNDDSEALGMMSSAIRKDYELDGKLAILFVARLIKLKNLHSLLKACSDLTVPYKLLVVGDGEMRHEWENESKSLNVSCSFLGQKNGLELDAVYHASDVLVLPSFIEAFGAVTNEALLQGCFCVISKNAGSSCLIEDGVNGYVCDPYSVDDIRDEVLLAGKLENREKKSLMPASFSFYFTPVVEMLM